MTCREKLKIEHPSAVNDCWEGGCQACPSFYGYAEKPDWGCIEEDACKRCWDREVEDKKLTSLCDDCAHKINCKNIDILKSVICSLRSAQVGASTPEGKIEVIKVRDIPWISLHLNCKNFMVDATSIYDKEMIL